MLLHHSVGVAAHSTMSELLRAHTIVRVQLNDKKALAGAKFIVDEFQRYTTGRLVYRTNNYLLFIDREWLRCVWEAVGLPVRYQ